METPQLQKNLQISRIAFDALMGWFFRHNYIEVYQITVLEKCTHH